LADLRAQQEAFERRHPHNIHAHDPRIAAVAAAAPPHVAHAPAVAVGFFGLELDTPPRPSPQQARPPPQESRPPPQQQTVYAADGGGSMVPAAVLQGKGAARLTSMFEVDGICVCACVCVRVRVLCMFMCVYTCMHESHTHIHTTHTDTHLFTYISVYIQSCIRTEVLKHIPACTHTHMLGLLVLNIQQVGPLTPRTTRVTPRLA
jgi:hypothetical protein